MADIIKVCAECGSSDVYAETTAYWNTETQSWEVSDVNGAFDENAYCNDCCGEAELKDAPL